MPTCRPARSRMWVISRVTVDLPLVPVIEIAGIRRASSRIQDGGVARAPAIRSCQRSTIRAWVPVSRVRRAGETLRDGEVERGLGDEPRPLGAGPGPRDDPPSRVGRHVDRDRAPVLAVVGAQAPGPGDEVGDLVRPLAGGHRAAEVDDARRCRSGIPARPARARRRPRP